MQNIRTFLLWILCLWAPLFAAGDSPDHADTSLYPPTQGGALSYQEEDDEEDDVVVVSDSERHEWLSYALTDTLVVAEISPLYRPYFSVTINETNPRTTLAESITITGHNTQPGGAVFINGVPVLLDESGLFRQTIQRDGLGDAFYIVTFTSQSQRFLSCVRSIRYLFDPKGTSDDSALNQAFTYVYNMDIVPHITQKSLSDVLIRSELAYALRQFGGAPILGLDAAEASDISPQLDKERAIAMVLDKQWMHVFPDGKFYPDKPVTRLDALLALLKAEGLFGQQRTTQSLVFTDISPSFWAHDHVALAVERGWLERSETFRPFEPISIATFISWIRHCAVVKEAFSFFSAPSSIERVDARASSYILPVIDHIEAQLALTDTPEETWEITSHEPFQLVTQAVQTIVGLLLPTGSMLVNNQPLYQQDNGTFGLPVTLNVGKNQWLFSIDGTSGVLTKNMTLFLVPGYADMTGHWLHDTVLKLRHLQLLPAGTLFDGKKIISRYDFIRILEPFLPYICDQYVLNQWEDQTDLQPFLDIPLADPLMKQALFYRENRIFDFSDPTLFLPTQSLTRMQGLMALIKVLNLPSLNLGAVSTQDKVFPFWDVAIDHPGRAYLQLAYDNGWVAEAHNFYPDKPLKKDQLLSLLSKLSAVTEVVNREFGYD